MAVWLQRNRKQYDKARIAAKDIHRLCHVCVYFVRVRVRADFLCLDDDSFPAQPVMLGRAKRPISDQGREANPEAQRTESGGGVLGEGAASPLTTTCGIWGSAVKAEFHYTGPTGPDRTRTDLRGLFLETWAADPGLRQSPRTLSGRVRSGPCSGI